VRAGVRRRLQRGGCDQQSSVRATSASGIPPVTWSPERGRVYLAPSPSCGGGLACSFVLRLAPRASSGAQNRGASLYDRLLITPARCRRRRTPGFARPLTDTLRLASADGGGVTWTALKTFRGSRCRPPRRRAGQHRRHAPGRYAPQSIATTLTRSWRPRCRATRSRVAVTSPCSPPRRAHRHAARAARLALRGASRRGASSCGSTPRRPAAHLEREPDRAWIALSSASGGAPPRDSTSSRCRRDTLAAGTQTGTIMITAPARSARRYARCPVQDQSHARRRPSPPTRSSPGRSSWPTRRARCAGSLTKQYRITANAGDTLTSGLQRRLRRVSGVARQSRAVPPDDDCPGQAGPSCIVGFRVPTRDAT